MKNRFITLIALLVIVATAFAADINIVYLKNGNKVRGEIIEQIPDKSVKLATADGSIFVFDMNDIEKITRVKPVESNSENTGKVVSSQLVSSPSQSASSIVYQNVETEALEQNQEKTESNDGDFALLYIYRPARATGAMVGYDIRLGDEVICRAKNKWKTTIPVRNFGQHTVWAKTESKEEVAVNFEPGQEYYIRCGLKMGAFVGRPTLELVDKSIGKSEFNAIEYKIDEVEKTTKEHSVAQQTPATTFQSTAVNSNSVKESTYQDFSEKEFKNVIRINPLAIIIAAAEYDGLELDMQYARYITPKVAIPVELDIFLSDWGNGFALLTGIEAVPVTTKRQKSGLFLNALAGIIVLDDVGYSEAGLMTTANIGYQLMTKKGFVFNVAIGSRYDTITEEIRGNFMLSVGFAF